MDRLTESELAAIISSQSGYSLRASDVLGGSRDPKFHASPSDPEKPYMARLVEVPLHPKKQGTLGAEQYARLAAGLFSEMPEVAAAEREYVIFAGYIADEQTPFVITRMVPAQITFRLLHRELPRLQSSTEKMMREVLRSRLETQPLHVSNPTIKVYERKFDHVILTGRVVTNAIRETIANELKDFILFLVPLFLFVLTMFTLLNLPSQPTSSPTIWKGMLERVSTALLTTSLVSALSLLHTYIQIRRHRLIDWSVKRDKKAS